MVKDVYAMAMTTYATSGIVSTPYFGDVFNAKRFKKWQNYQLSICTPYEGKWNSDAGLTLFDQEYNIIIETDIEQMFECMKLDSVNNNCLDKNVTKFQTNLKKIMVGNYTYNTGCKTIIFERNFQSKLEILVTIHKTWKKQNSVDTRKLLTSILMTDLMASISD